jgi:hypothetical protein
MLRKSSGDMPETTPNGSDDKAQRLATPVGEFERIQESKQQPVWHVVVLCILTCTGYFVYWFYKNWRDLAAEANLRLEEEPDLQQFKNISPMLRSIGLIAPMATIWLTPLLIYLMMMQFKGIAQLVPDRQAFPRKHPIVSASILMAALTMLVSLAGLLSGPWMLVSFLVGVPLGFAQHWLNAYYNAVEPPGLIVRHAFSVKEIAAIIIGGMLLGLVVTGFFLKPQ